MDEITKTGYSKLDENKPIYVTVCCVCKEAFRTNDNQVITCGDCIERAMDYEWINGSPHDHDWED